MTTQPFDYAAIEATFGSVLLLLRFGINPSCHELWAGARACGFQTVALPAAGRA
jgi:hypothetical protein